MRTLGASLLLFCLAGMLSIINAQLPGTFNERLPEFEAFVQEQLEAKEIVGLSVAVSDGTTEWAKGYGLADIENQVAATENAMYRLASVTKPMTAVGILALVEDGKIDLDAEVQIYVPDFPKKRWPLTTRHLLGHLGGVSHYRNYDQEAGTVKHMTTEEALSIFQDWELLHEPGTRYRYTTYGYNLLWAIIEGASGQSFADFMREHVWGVAGMETISVDYLYKLIPNRVRGYRKSNGHIENTRPVSTSLKVGGGGTCATVLDMVRFSQALSAGKMLSEKTLAQMWVPMTMTNSRYSGYGMGWGISNYHGRYLVIHSGAQEGTRTILMHLPGTNLSVAAASNLEGANVRAFAFKLMDALLGADSQPMPYLENPADAALYQALRFVYNDGLTYFEWREQPYTEDKNRLETAFLYVDRFEHLSRGADGGPASADSHIEDGRHPISGVPFKTAGAYMAHLLAQKNGRDYIWSLANEGVLAFANAYVQLYKQDVDIPQNFRFEDETGEKIVRWHNDMSSWSDKLVRMNIGAENAHEVHLSLKTELAKGTLLPDYTDEISYASFDALHKDQLEEAMLLAKLGKELYPGSPTALGTLGILYLVTDAPEVGSHMVSESNSLAPNGFANQNNLNSMAYSLMAAGKVDYSIEILDMAIHLNPTVANLYDSMGEMYLVKKDTTTSIHFYDKALEIDPDFENAKLMLQRIGAE